MKKYKPALVIFSILINCLSVAATTYYVRQDGSSNTSGRSDADAWNYAMLNSRILSAGDSVLFKRGDVFFGQLYISSGRAGLPVHYGAYASGANPVISGLVSIADWVHYSGNIYYAVPTKTTAAGVNLVLRNNKVTAMGRYPNTGQLNYTSHQANTAIAGTAIGAIPFNATGAEAVIRKVRWILDRHPVTAHNSNTLSLSTTSPDGGALGYEAVDKNGFFIQNHLATLDREGEWYFEKTTKRLYMFLSSTEPEVQVAAVDRLVAFNSKSFVRMVDIDFEGSNIHAVSITGGSNITLERCRFYHHGQTAIYGNVAVNIQIKESSFRHCLNSGIWIEQGGSNVTVDRVETADIGTIPGAGRSGDGAQQAISVAGNNTKVQGCTVIRTGYNGIHFDGSNALIERNLVDSFCLVKDDGGGIYTYENDGVQVANRVVQNNIVLHAVGAFAGAESYYYERWGKAAGIYLDGNSNHTLVTKNVVAHGEWSGLFVNNNGTNDLVANLFYDHAASILLLQSKAGNIRNMVIKNNECIARTNYQKTLVVRMFEKDNPALFGTFSANFYARPVDDFKTIAVEKFYEANGEHQLTLSEWKTQYGVDLNSGKSTIVAEAPSSIRFDYNASSSPRLVTLKGAWKDIHNAVFENSLMVPSFSAKVTMYIPGFYSTLAVKEASFTAAEQGTAVRLQWKGIGETDAVFAVERSRNGVTFSKIGEVKGSGSPLETAYAFMDLQPLTGTNYYRLKTVDANGSYLYTKVISVRMGATAAQLQVFPNPATHAVNVQLPAMSGEVIINLSDMSGKTVKAVRLGQLPTAQLYTVDISNLPRGQYLLSANQYSQLVLKQ